MTPPLISFLLNTVSHGTTHFNVFFSQVYGSTVLKELDKQLEAQDIVEANQNLEAPRVKDVCGEYLDTAFFGQVNDPEMFLRRKQVDVTAYLSRTRTVTTTAKQAPLDKKAQATGDPLTSNGVTTKNGAGVSANGPQNNGGKNGTGQFAVGGNKTGGVNGSSLYSANESVVGGGNDTTTSSTAAASSSAPTAAAADASSPTPLPDLEDLDFENVDLVTSSPSGDGLFDGLALNKIKSQLQDLGKEADTMSILRQIVGNSESHELGGSRGVGDGSLVSLPAAVHYAEIAKVNKTSGEKPALMRILEHVKNLENHQHDLSQRSGSMIFSLKNQESVITLLSSVALSLHDSLRDQKQKMDRLMRLVESQKNATAAANRAASANGTLSSNGTGFRGNGTAEAFVDLDIYIQQFAEYSASFFAVAATLLSWSGTVARALSDALLLPMLDFAVDLCDSLAEWAAAAAEESAAVERNPKAPAGAGTTTNGTPGTTNGAPGAKMANSSTSKPLLKSTSLPSSSPSGIGAGAAGGGSSSAKSASLRREEVQRRVGRLLRTFLSWERLVLLYLVLAHLWSRRQRRILEQQEELPTDRDRRIVAYNEEMRRRRADSIGSDGGSSDAGSTLNRSATSATASDEDSSPDSPVSTARMSEPFELNPTGVVPSQRMSEISRILQRVV